MDKSSVSRRDFVKSGISAGLAVSVAAGGASASALANPDSDAVVRKGRIKQSVSRWCYKDVKLDDLCAYAAKIGLKGVDLLAVEEWDAPRKVGLICTMGYAGGGTIPDALNRVENHDAIVAAIQKNIPIAAKMGVPNVITFSGNRKGMSDEEGAKNCVIGLNRAEEDRRRQQRHYLHGAVEQQGEPQGLHVRPHRVGRWRDGAGELAEHQTALRHLPHADYGRGPDPHHYGQTKWMGHFHTGGVPGRHELNDQQEVQWDGVMRGIVATGYTGYVAHEFVPTGDPLTSLRQAVDLCDV